MNSNNISRHLIIFGSLIFLTCIYFAYCCDLEFSQTLWYCLRLGLLFGGVLLIRGLSKYLEQQR